MCYLILVKGFNKMETTISIHWNKGAVARLHNDRNEDLCSHESHIDLINEHGNSKHESWLKSIDMVKAYEKIFRTTSEDGWGNERCVIAQHARHTWARANAGII